MALERALGALGLNVLMPLAPREFDAACAPATPDVRLDRLLPGARAALIVGSGGPTFFDHFACESHEARDGAANPLDRFTARVVGAAVAAALAPLAVAHATYFPFVASAPLIPFQRLGRAAGLGGPGPLGLQIHPVYGPWWAYRALVVVDRELPRRCRARRRLCRLRRAVRRRVPGVRGRCHRFRRPRVPCAPAGGRAVQVVVRRAHRVRARPRTSLLRQPARLSHERVDA